nr:glutaredoxin domain-containing protein [Spirochaeta lutea]
MIPTAQATPTPGDHPALPGQSEPGPGKTGAPPSGPRLLLFTSPGCPRCPAATALLEDAGRPYTPVDAASPEGNREASDRGITAVPTLIALDPRSSREIWRTSDPGEMRSRLREREKPFHVGT